MADIQRQFELIVKNQLAKKISKATIRKAANAAGKAAIDMIRERTKYGIDYNGKRLPKLTKLYRKMKASGQALRNAKGTKTQFAAKGVPNHGRLTGRLFSSMRYQVKKTNIKKGEIDILVELFVKGKDADKVDWLEKNWGATRLWGRLKTPRRYSKAQRHIFGLSKKGAWKKREEEAIKEAFINSFVKNSEVLVK